MYRFYYYDSTQFILLRFYYYDSTQFILFRFYYYDSTQFILFRFYYYDSTQFILFRFYYYDSTQFILFRFYYYGSTRNQKKSSQKEALTPRPLLPSQRALQGAETNTSRPSPVPPKVVHYYSYLILQFL